MRKTIERITTFAVAVAEPDEIILFGSVADGTNGVHSDLDLLIITESIYDRKNISAKITAFARELSLKADVLIHTEDELKAASENPTSFLASIVQNGKIIYQKNEKSL